MSSGYNRRYWIWFVAVISDLTRMKKGNCSCASSRTMISLVVIPVARLIGLAFDGNWEAMSGDIAFEPDLQRCIGVDIRYVLFMIDKWGKCPRLIEELKLVR